MTCVLAASSRRMQDEGHFRAPARASQAAAAQCATAPYPHEAVEPARYPGRLGAEHEQCCRPQKVQLIQQQERRTASPHPCGWLTTRVTKGHT